MKFHHSNSKLLFSLFLFLVSVCFLSCSKSGSNAAPKNTGTPLAITSLNVNSGPYTTSVTITGTGFSNTATDDKVFFNGVPADIMAASSTQLLTSVPLAAGTGNVTITINGKTVTGPLFTYQKTEIVTTFAGDENKIGSADGLGTAASFFQPNAIAADGVGNLYVADTFNNLIRKITPDGQVSTLAGNGTSGSANGVGKAASFSSLNGIVTDASGNIYVSEMGTNLIRKITPAGEVSTIAGNGRAESIDGVGSAAGFANPMGLAVDGSGNIFVVDQGSGKIRKITPAGSVTTVYNNIYAYYIVLDKTGNMYLTDPSSNKIIKVNTTGTASVLAGGASILPGSNDGTGSVASFYGPFGITFDANGNLLVTDTQNQAIRMITTAGVVTTISGRQHLSFNGPIATATFDAPTGITVDPAGNIYVVDVNSIRKISVQ